MATVHMILQGKGGVGKSMVSVLLYQALHHMGLNVHGIDTDPVNATLKGFSDLDVTRLDIMRDDNIDVRMFDALIEKIFGMPEDSHVIIDNGASAFVAFGSYLKENEVISLLQENNHQIYLHTVITGGQAILDTTQGLKVLATGFPSVPLCVWLNPYFGEISMDGLGFTSFKIYQEHERQIHAVIQIPTGNKSTLGQDLQELYAKRNTFKAALDAESSLSIAVRSRLRRYFDQIVTAVKVAQIAA